MLAAADGFGALMKASWMPWPGIAPYANSECGGGETAETGSLGAPSKPGLRTDDAKKPHRR